MRRIIFFLLIFTNCTTSNLYEVVIYNPINDIQLYNNNSKENWYLKDIQKNSLPGISLEKAYNTILKKKKGKEVIIAVLDGNFNINHETIKPFIWTNYNETPNNGIDDDANGYIDDVNGWNFLANAKGEQTIYSHFESTKIVKFYNNTFKGVNSTKLSTEDLKKYNLYLKAKKTVEDGIKESKEDFIAVSPKFIKEYKDALQKISPYLIKEKLTLKNLDSLKQNQSSINKEIAFISRMIKYNVTLKDLEEELKYHINKVEKYFNINYDDRSIVGDNLNDITDVNNYGGNDVTLMNYKIAHGTYTTGIISSLINNDIKIMPVAISAYGDEHDKDIALAIKYAVDNGAKVINMSSSKDFSLHEYWVKDALKYAENKNVLFITSAGNNSNNIDETTNYPNDVDDKNREILNNFIKVGASTKHLNNNLKAKLSNYGKNEVDVFAPGDSIYSPSSKYKNKTFEYISGTSLSAPIVSGVAALLYSYYPNLTASQVKHIIMDSGVEYTFPVKTPTEADKDKMTPFNELSKSGKIVNAYNALIMADSVSKSNKRKHE